MNALTAAADRRTWQAGLDSLLDRVLGAGPDETFLVLNAKLSSAIDLREAVR